MEGLPEPKTVPKKRVRKEEIKDDHKLNTNDMMFSAMHKRARRWAIDTDE